VKPPRPSTAFEQGARVVEIATVLSASGFGWMVAALGLDACVSLRCRLACGLGRRPCPHHVAMDQPLPQRLRLVLERLGPTFVKAGQILALRPDYIPLPYAEALGTLHADAHPFGADQARTIIEAELGAPLEELFTDFEPTPFAAASLSQVHRATLPDDQTVAVKVQRPGIERQIEQDLALLERLARRLERRRPDTMGFRPRAAVAELADYTRRELDFRQEATVAARVRARFADDPHVIVPQVHPERSSRRVLTTALVEGHRPAPAGQLRAVGLDPDTLLQVGAQAMLRQIFGHGLFHADPHPGNLLFLDGDRVCFLDFGLYGRLDLRQRRRMGFLLWALLDGDHNTVADQLLRLSIQRPGADADGFRAALAELVDDWQTSPPGAGYTTARLLLRELAAGARHGIVFPRELMLLARALATIEATAAVIEPDANLVGLATPLLPELRRLLLFDPDQLRQRWHASRFDLLELTLELPDLLAELARRLPATAPTAATDSPVTNPPVALALVGGGEPGRDGTTRRPAPPPRPPRFHARDPEGTAKPHPHEGSCGWQPPAAPPC
jgi:ubiquinone biosynthesis protein